MPVYEYLCGKCERKFELLVRSAEAKVACPGCRSRKVRKLFSVFGLQLGASPAHGSGCG
jgi:putative FmdB family regulatory protein